MNNGIQEAAEVADKAAAKQPKTVIPPIPPVPQVSDEIVQAKKLLRANGYWLFPFGRICARIKRGFRRIWRMLKIWKLAYSEWRAKRRAQNAVRRQEKAQKAEEARLRRAEEEKRRAAILLEEVRLAAIRAEEERLRAMESERQRQAEAEIRRAAMLKDELRLAELRKETAQAQPTDSPSNACPACGAVLAPTAKFCRKCGAPVPSAPSSAGIVSEENTPVPLPDVPPVGRAPEPQAAQDSEPLQEDEVNEAAPPPVPQNKCPACGADLKPNALFCTKCGIHL